MRKRRSKPRDSFDQAGFTLFETLVALAILTIGLGAFYRAIAGGASGEARIERTSMALRIAKAKLAAAGIEDRLVAGQHSGEDAAGYRWRVSVGRHAAANGLVATGSVAAYDVSVEVSWAGAIASNRPSITLTTLKLAPPS